MLLSEYLVFALRTAVYPNLGKNWQYPTISLAGEVGELLNKLKKTLRDDNGLITNKKRDECLDELGDIAWYFVMLCYELHIDPDSILEINVKKLRKRMQDNTIHDNGGPR